MADTMITARTAQGTLRGVQKEHCSVFYSIPYAAPPVGEQRFCPPAPPAAWPGVRDAGKPLCRPWAPEQPQDTACGREFYFDGQYHLPCDEDSLFVHVWTPAHSAEERLPVAVWIHGGAFQKGYGPEVETDGEGFCRRGVVFVAVEYRMGVLGFLCHPELASEQGGHCGNYGILDQIAALRWVHDNITAFGGDPDKVTIIGQSAGAMSVQILSATPLTKGLMRAAVMQSGGGYQSPLTVNVTQAEAERVGERFAAFCGVRSVGELRAMSARELTARMEAFQQELDRDIAFVPVVDGLVLDASMDTLTESGRCHNLAFLMGCNDDDLFMPGMRNGIFAWSQNNIRLGRRPAYVYQFKRVPPGEDSGTYHGCYHSAELWYVFETCRRSWRPYTPEDLALSARMADYWCSFVKNGDPNTPGLSEWRPCHAPEDILTLDI